MEVRRVLFRSEENTNTGTLVRRMLSDDASDKVIVCTIQKLGLALDGGSTRNQSREKRGLATHAEKLEALRNKRMVFIFDECHRSQFGDHHQAIKIRGASCRERGGQ